MSAPRELGEYPVFYTVQQVAQTLNISRNSVIRLGKEGVLEIMRLGKSVRVTERSLTRLIDEKLKRCA